MSCICHNINSWRQQLINIKTSVAGFTTLVFILIEIYHIKSTPYRMRTSQRGNVILRNPLGHGEVYICCVIHSGAEK